MGAGISAFGIIASVWTDSTMAASAFIALVAFGVQLQLPSWWATATKVSGRHLGAIFGLMNMMGGLGRILSQQFVGRFADWRKSLGYTGRDQWDPSLYLYVGIAWLDGFLGFDQPGEDCGRSGDDRSGDMKRVNGQEPSPVRSRGVAAGRDHPP